MAHHRRILNAAVTLLAAALAAFILTGCNGSANQATNTPTPIPPTDTFTPVPATDTPTPIPPTNTPTPIPPTDTPTTVPPTDTPTSPPGPDLSEISVYAVSHLSGDRLLVTLQVPGGFEGEYQSTTADTTQSCEVLPEYPDRLYCTGPEPFQNFEPVAATFRLYAEGQSQPVFETEFTVPARPTPTPTITPTLTPTATIEG